jgi:outer membrane biosynthesis protein TonB
MLMKKRVLLLYLAQMFRSMFEVHFYAPQELDYKPLIVPPGVARFFSSNPILGGRRLVLLTNMAYREPTDLAEWLAERKSRFPTKARREAAKLVAEEEHRKRSQRRADKAKNPQQQQKVKQESEEIKPGETKLEREQRKAAKLRSELEKAERKIQNAMQGSKRKRENGDEGDDDRDDQVNDEDSDDSSESDDGEPEAQSSRSTGPQHVAQPAKAQLQRHCKYFSTGGTCGKKGKCRFVHDVDVRNKALADKEANGGKMTLAQRLILNDTAKDDLTILKSIKYLKEKGLMKDSTPATSANGDVKSEDYTNMEYGDAT